MNKYCKVNSIQNVPNGTKVTILIPGESLAHDLVQRKIHSGEIWLPDGRTLSPEQRKKIFALINDISLWNYDDADINRFWLTQYFCIEKGIEPFSLSPKKPNVADMTLAKEFVNYLIEFCFINDIATLDNMMHYTDDINTYLYLCIKHKKCAICQDKGEIHHSDAIGMGRNRRTVDDSFLKKICLCRKHHTEAHTIGRDTFFRKYHVYGIKYTE